MAGSEFYDHTTYPSQGAAGSSSAARAEFELIEAGFDKLAPLAGNGGKIVAINAGGTAQEAITTTGTGSGVRATSPTLVTPVIGATTFTGVGAYVVTFTFTGITGVTFPTAGTLATLAGAETLTNKALNGTLGATTPAAGTFTTLMASGAVGIGVTPPAWSGIRALDIGTASALGGYIGNAGTYLVSNAYFNGTNWIYRTTSGASSHEQYNGVHTWNYAPSGTAGNVVTFVAGMTMSATGAVTIPNTLAISTAGSTIATEAVIAPTLINSWVNFGTGYQTAGYWKDAFGYVHLHGMIKSGAAGTIAFTLPVGYRPALDLLIATTSNNAFGQATITTAGSVTVSVGSGTHFSFNSISFRV